MLTDSHHKNRRNKPSQHDKNKNARKKDFNVVLLCEVTRFFKCFFSYFCNVFFFFFFFSIGCFLSVRWFGWMWLTRGSVTTDRRDTLTETGQISSGAASTPSSSQSAVLHWNTKQLGHFLVRKHKKNEGKRAMTYTLSGSR